MRRRLANLCTIYPYEYSRGVLPENLDANQTIMLLEDAFQTPYNRLNEALYRELQ
jgi:hypothetical protein